VPLRNARPISWRPKGLTDAKDGTNAFAGAMKTLQNLIPDRANTDVWVPRPAATEKTNFAGGPPAAGFISARLVVGDIEYGMVASSTTPGFDEPYAYDIANGVFLPVSGITGSNVPASPPTSGFWTPPIMAQVGNRIIVTHPGFPGGEVSFGWFDLSGAQLGAVGDTVSGSRYITGNPNLLGVQPGLAVSGTGIPAGTVVVNTHPYPIGFDFVGDTHTSTVIDGIADTSGLKATLFISGLGILSGTRIVAVHANSIDISPATTSSVAGGTIQCYGENVLQVSPPADIQGTTNSNTTLSPTTPNITGGAPLGAAVGQGISGPGLLPLTTITSVGVSALGLSQAATITAVNDFKFEGATIVLSANATATNDGVSFTITGGTAAAPLWGAGNTNNFSLPSVPVGVAQMNGRAWYALGRDGIVFSDSGSPCSVSNTLGVQALTTNDGLGVTAIAPLLLSAPITGGIVQALIAFEEDVKMQQITGDQATGNLAMNLLPVATGTHSPLSIVPTEAGLAFISPTGLRFVTFNGTVTPPVGAYGQGIVEPFINATEPSRVCAAANAGVLRITTQNGLADGDSQEYWLDLTKQIWHGPHTFPASLIQPWRTSFLIAPVGIEHSLWQSDAYVTTASVYVENGDQMLWVEESVLLPDNAVMAMNAMVQASIMFSLAPPLAIEVMALDEDRGIIDQAFAQGVASAMRQRSLDWSEPVVFKQMSFLVKGQSDASLRLGNLYMNIAPVNYLNDGGRPNLVKVDAGGVVVP
jgi:hypothetical protein